MGWSAALQVRPTSAHAACGACLTRCWSARAAGRRVWMLVVQIRRDMSIVLSLAPATRKQGPLQPKPVGQPAHPAAGHAGRGRPYQNYSLLDPLRGSGPATYPRAGEISIGIAALGYGVWPATLARPTPWQSYARRNPADENAPQLRAWGRGDRGVGRSRRRKVRRRVSLTLLSRAWDNRSERSLGARLLVLERTS